MDQVSGSTPPRCIADGYDDSHRLPGHHVLSRRDAVFAAFRPQQARALDQADFQDHAPDQLPRRLTEADASGEVPLDQLAAALRLDADDAESQAV